MDTDAASAGIVAVATTSFTGAIDINVIIGATIAILIASVVRPLVDDWRRKKPKDSK